MFLSFLVGLKTTGLNLEEKISAKFLLSDWKASHRLFHREDTLYSCVSVLGFLKTVQSSHYFQ